MYVNVRKTYTLGIIMDTPTPNTKQFCSAKDLHGYLSVTLKAKIYKYIYIHNGNRQEELERLKKITIPWQRMYLYK